MTKKYPKSIKFDKKHQTLPVVRSSPPPPPPPPALPLQLSKRAIHVFREAMFSLLRLGGGKNLNIPLDGPANCGKLFLLNQLSI